MTIYDNASGPSRASRITLPPMMMVPQDNHRPLDLHSQAPYLRHPYAEYEYDYEFANSTSYQHTYDNNEYQDRHEAEMPNTRNSHDCNGPLSLSLLVAAAHAAQADISYGHSPIHYNSLPLSCGMDTSENYSPALTSADAQGNWPPIGLSASDSDRLAASPPQTPLATPDVTYDTSAMTCCRSQNDESIPQEAKWNVDRIGAEPPYISKSSLPSLSHIEYCNHGIAVDHQHPAKPTECLAQFPTPTTSTPLHKTGSSNLTSRPVIRRTCKNKRIIPKAEEHESPEPDETSPVSEPSPKTGKPKQGRKKRSAGYVRPIIIHRKRVGQRLLDMLKNAPTPSKAPSMELNRARCFPFADMKNKLREWYGLQIEWPTEAPFRVEELRSTRRMRLDELERLDKTLDGGEVRLRLSEEVLAEEPHRAAEYSLPSDGHTEEHSSEPGALENPPYHHEEEPHESNRRRKKRRI